MERGARAPSLGSRALSVSVVNSLGWSFVWGWACSKKGVSWTMAVLCPSSPCLSNGTRSPTGWQRISEAKIKHRRQTRDKLAAQHHVAKVGRRVVGELKQLEKPVSGSGTYAWWLKANRLVKIGWGKAVWRLAYKSRDYDWWLLLHRNGNLVRFKFFFKSVTWSTVHD